MRFSGFSGSTKSASRVGWLISANGCCSFWALLSMAVAAVFITGQTDYKRMLAYSSVEHMGILAVGVGLGGAGLFGAMLHVINHSLTKVMLFMVAGNLLAVYHTKTAKDVSGALQVLPVSGLLWVLGFLAITGSPPFGPFLSEFTILKAALDQGRSFVAIAYLVLLAIILAGMATPVLAMAQGTPRRRYRCPCGPRCRTDRGAGNTRRCNSADGHLRSSGPEPDNS